MELGRRRQRSTAWLAALLFALATLAPTASRALAFVQGQIAPWAVVCSAAEDARRPGPADAASHIVDHCPACQLQLSDPWCLPPAERGMPTWQALHEAPTLAGSTALAAGPPWPRALPRAPPVTR